MIHLGFNQDLAGRMVWDGVFPRIAARQTPMNFRFALPGGAATLYEPGASRPCGGRRYDDKTRGRAAAEPARSLHGDEDVSESHRGLWIDGVLGPAHVAGSHRHRRAARYSAARQRAALLLSRGRRMAAAAGIPHRVPRLAAAAPCRQSESRSGSDTRADGSSHRVGRAAARRRPPAAIRC